MGLFTKLNERIVAAIDRRAGVSPVSGVELAADELAVEHADRSVIRMPWPDLQSAVALRRDLYAGDEVSLLLDFGRAGLVEIPASARGWPALCAMLDRRDGAVPFVRWHAGALALETGQATAVWTRPA